MEAIEWRTNSKKAEMNNIMDKEEDTDTDDDAHIKVCEHIERKQKTFCMTVNGQARYHPNLGKKEG